MQNACLSVLCCELRGAITARLPEADAENIALQPKNAFQVHVLEATSLSVESIVIGVCEVSNLCVPLMTASPMETVC